jgi:hypothetical protein
MYWPLRDFKATVPHIGTSQEQSSIGMNGMLHYFNLRAKLHIFKHLFVVE